nr:protein ALP1-like isoform X1 [Procambarus clarkii]
MTSRHTSDLLFTFLLAEELDAVDSAYDALKYHKLSKNNLCARPIKRQKLSHADPVQHFGEGQIVIKTEESESRRRRKGSRSAENYLQKGGMMAFYNYNLSDFRVHFGMTRPQVEELFTELQPHYRYERGTKLPLENVVLASLWVLSSQESYRIIAERFQTSKSVICTSLHHFCNLVSGNLENRISWPCESALANTVKGFEEAGFPGTIGAIDACHIAINKPKDVEEPEAYMNDKNVFCTTLLAVCDNEHKFTYVNVGHPGTLCDANVFRRCELFQAFNDDPHSLLPLEFQLGNDIFPYHIISDVGFPLSVYVMTPYEDNGYLTAREINYNKRHLSAMMIISRSICLLKSRFSRLKLLLMQHLAQCSVAIKACCILHNICMENGDFEALDIDEDDIPPPPTETCTDFQPCIVGEGKRNAIADSFL